MNPKSELHSEPQKVTNLEDCFFYHTVDIPGHGHVKGQWDFRNGAEKFLGGVSVAGKNVLEVGTADGFLAFDMEQRGADVVGYDISAQHTWDIVPFGGKVSVDHLAMSRKWTVGINNAWWFLHRALSSKAKLLYGSVYDIPAELGPFDIGTISCVLLHLRDPFLAMQRAGAVISDTLIVTEVVAGFKQVPQPIIAPPRDPEYTFLPDAKIPEQCFTWWNLSPIVIQRYMGILGFPHTSVTYHDQFYEGERRWITLYTVVGRRAAGSE